MNNFVEEFASKLDEAKTLTMKMTVNQEVEVLKYVFLFVEQLQKDLIEKLTIRGSLVTFSFVPESRSLVDNRHNVYVTPDANISWVRQSFMGQCNGKDSSSFIQEEVEDEYELCDGFHQTCDELDQHYSLSFIKTENDSVIQDGAEIGPLVRSTPLEDSNRLTKLKLESSLNIAEGSSVSLICLSDKKTRTVSTHCKRTLTAKLQANLNKAKAGDSREATRTKSVNSTAKKNCRQMKTALAKASARNGIGTSASNNAPADDEAPPPKRSRPKTARRCRRERVDGKYMCSFPGCLDKYSNLEHMADHELQHTVPGGHFWPCSQCPQRFKWRHYLRLHLKLQHSCTRMSSPVSMPVA